MAIAQIAGNYTLGQTPQFFESGVTAITGKEIWCIQVTADCVFTTLTPAGTTVGIGTTNQNGDSVATKTFTAGQFLFGSWTGFTLASGEVIGHEAL